MAIAAVGTFLAYAGATSDDPIEVLIASHDLRSGDIIAAGDVRMVSVDLPDEVRGLFGAVDAAVGRTVVAPVDAGEFLLASATAPAIEGDETLEVTIELPGFRAVGRLRPGDRVDVFSTWGGAVTELIAVDARVVEASGATGAVTGGELVVVRLALAEFDQIEAVVHAQAAGDITLISAALGTERQDVGREYRPLATGHSSDESGASEDRTDSAEGGEG